MTTDLARKELLLTSDDLCSCASTAVDEACAATIWEAEVDDSTAALGAVLGRCLQRWRLEQIEVKYEGETVALMHFNYFQVYASMKNCHLSQMHYIHVC